MLEPRTILAHWCLVAAILLLVACTPKTSQTVWQETFDDAGPWRLSADAAADVTVEDGHLRIHILQPAQIAWTSAPQVYKDFTLQVTATQVSGPADNEYGVLVRMEGDTTFYAFSISGDGYARAALFDERGWTVLGNDWFLSDAVHQGAASNVLEVEAAGEHYVFRVNGQEVLQVDDATRLKGDIGLYAGAFTEGDVVVTFDDLHVAPLEP